MFRKIFKAVVARFGGMPIGMVANFVVPAVLFRHFQTQTLGIWYLISGVTTVAGLLQFGLPDTWTRFVAFASSDGIRKAEPGTENRSGESLSRIIIVASRSARYVAVISSAGSLVFGMVILNTLHLAPTVFWNAVGALAIISTGVALSTRFSFWDSVITGTGDAHLSAIINTTSGLSYSVLQIIVAFVSPNLYSLALAFLTQTVATRMFVTRFARRRYGQQLVEQQGVFDQALFKKVLALSIKQWVAIVAAFTVLKTDQYFFAVFFTVGDVALYTAAASLVGILGTVSAAGNAVTSPFISQAWAQKAVSRIRRLVMVQVRCSMLVMLCGATIVLAMGGRLFDFWLGEGKFIGYPVLALLVVMAVLELHHGILVAFLYAINRVEIYVQAVISAVLNLVFTLAFIKPFGLVGIPLGTFAAQVCTSYWYGTYKALPALEIPFPVYLRETLAPLCFWGVCFVFAARLAVLLPVGPVVQLTFTAVSCGGICFAGIWLWGLDATTRRWIAQIILEKL